MTKYAKCGVCGYTIAISEDVDAGDYVCPIDGTTLEDATKTDYMVTKKSAATFIVAASDSLHLERADYVCDGVDDQVEIQAAIDALPANGGNIALMDGTFDIRGMITGADYVDIYGVGFGTIFDVTNIGANNVITLGDYSSLSKLKISGTVTPFPSPGLQQTIAGNHCKISDIWITDVGYGIEASNKTDVTIENVILTNIRDDHDWAAAVHAGGSSNRICVRNFYIEGCNRGCEVEDGAQWFTAENGFMKDIQNYNGTGHEPFAMDCHMHDGASPVKHIRYKNIYAENTYPPQSRVLGAAPSGRNEDIVWENIWLVSPIAKLIFNGINITARNVNGFHLTSIASANTVLIENCEHGYQYSGNPSWDIGDAQNVTIRNCRILAHTSNQGSGVKINSANAADIRIIDNDFLDDTFPSAVEITNALRGIVIKGNKINSAVPTVTGLTKLAIAYDKYSDLFMDVLAVSAMHVRSNEDLSEAIPNTFTIDAQPDVPRTLSGHFDAHANITAYTIDIVGVDAKGNIVTEQKTEADGWDWETSNAFATITSIIMSARTGTGATDTMDIGITDVLGLSNIIYETGDVYKIKKNNANAVVVAAQVDTDYDTYDMSVIGLAATDDFTIWFKSNLNIIS